MGNLQGHVGKKAELYAAPVKQVAAFLQRHAAAMSDGEYDSERVRQATAGRASPVCISLTDYSRGQRYVIPETMVGGKHELRGFSRREGCHAGAEQAVFDGRNVRIPGCRCWEE